MTTSREKYNAGEAVVRNLASRAAAGKGVGGYLLGATVELDELLDVAAAAADAEAPVEVLVAPAFEPPASGVVDGAGALVDPESELAAPSFAGPPLSDRTDDPPAELERLSVL